MRISTAAISKAIFGAIGAVIGLKLFDFVNGSDSPIYMYLISAVVFFVLILARSYSKGELKEVKPQKESISKEAHLKEIYSSRTDQQLKDMISNQSIADEAKIIARKILESRRVENEA